MAEKRNLPIQNMADRHPGLTANIAGTYYDAARVCLDRHHSPPVPFRVEDAGSSRNAAVAWEATDERCRAAYANEIDTTELGAYACALAATEITRGLFALRRAETRTGADYYLAPQGTSLDDLEDCFRLEVSGVDHGSPA